MKMKKEKKKEMRVKLQKFDEDEFSNASHQIV